MPLNVRDTFPLTHSHAVRILAKAEWNRIERIRLMQASFEELRASVGSALKTYWYMADKTYPLPRHYQASYGIGHVDDMVRLILKNFAAELRDQEFDLEQEVRAVRKFWTDQGLDPVTMERLP